MNTALKALAAFAITIGVLSMLGGGSRTTSSLDLSTRTRGNGGGNAGGQQDDGMIRIGQPGQQGNGGVLVPGAGGTDVYYEEPKGLPGGETLGWLYKRWIRHGTWLRKTEDGRVKINHVPTCKAPRAPTIAGRIADNVNQFFGALNICQHGDASIRANGGDTLPKNVDYMWDKRRDPFEGEGWEIQ